MLSPWVRYFIPALLWSSGWQDSLCMTFIRGHRLSIKIKLTLVIVLNNAYAQEMNEVVVFFLYCEL